MSIVPTSWLPERKIRQLLDERYYSEEAGVDSEQGAIDYLNQSITNSVFPINSPYFHSDGSPLSYSFPKLMRALGEHGFDFDTPGSIGTVRDKFIDGLNQRDLQNVFHKDEKKVLAAFRVLGEFSRSDQMVKQIEKSQFPKAKQAFNEGKERAISNLAREIDPHLLPPLARIAAQYVLGDPNTLFETRK